MLKHRINENSLSTNYLGVGRDVTLYDITEGPLPQLRVSASVL